MVLQPNLAEAVAIRDPRVQPMAPAFICACGGGNGGDGFERPSQLVRSLWPRSAGSTAGV